MSATTANAAVGGTIGARAAAGTAGTGMAAFAAFKFPEHKFGFVLRNLFTAPWAGWVALRDSRAAIAQTAKLFGGDGRAADNLGRDAFRHAYWSAMMVRNMQRDHGVTATRADDLARQVGIAQENDASLNLNSLSRQMDVHNNGTGRQLAGSGRDADGTWLTDEQLRDRVLTAMQGGKLKVFDGPGKLRATSMLDLPTPPA